MTDCCIQTTPKGSKVFQISLASEILSKTSKAGFKENRPHTVYVPKVASEKNLPSVYLLASWLSAGRSMFQWEPFREDLASRFDRLIESKIIPPCVVICPDLYTPFGGSQYVNSSWIGHHGDHIVFELIPYIESNFPVHSGPTSRVALGRSSGGFGALRLAMDYDHVFSAVACHAGDMGFEWVYRRSLIDLPVGLYKQRDPLLWIKDVMAQKKLSGFDTHLLMLLGMAAFYSPDPDSQWGYSLPITLRDGELDEKIWAQWIEQDPISRLDLPRTVERLGKLRELYLDCGNRDQYFLHYGARQFVKKAKGLGLKVNYDEFDDNHSQTAYRYDISLPRLLSTL